MGIGCVTSQVEGRKRKKKGFHPLHGAALGFLPKFGGLAGRVGWKKGDKATSMSL